MKLYYGAALVAAVLLALLVAIPASAHSTPDAAADTPLGGQSRDQPAAANFDDALANSQGADNSLTRNPTCGVHNTAAGEHPPGNP